MNTYWRQKLDEDWQRVLAGQAGHTIPRTTRKDPYAVIYGEILDRYTLIIDSSLDGGLRRTQLDEATVNVYLKTWEIPQEGWE